MAKNTITFSADANTELATIIRRHDSQSYAASIFVKGDDGGGTWTLQVSPDDGTTKYTVKDVLGNNITGTANGYYNYVLSGDSSNNSGNMKLYIDLTGSTNPTLTVINYDNR